MGMVVLNEDIGFFRKYIGSKRLPQTGILGYF
jgi:hypothetical protein